MEAGMMMERVGAMRHDKVPQDVPRTSSLVSSHPLPCTLHASQGGGRLPFPDMFHFYLLPLSLRVLPVA